MVRSLKVFLPVLGLLSIGSYAAFLATTAKLKGLGLDPGQVEIDPKNLTMKSPRYEGFGKDGSRFVVRARDAITDLKQTGPIRLNEIDGTITQLSGVVTKLKATWGTYDQKKDILELYEKIDVDGSTGMTARLTRATVHAKESRVISPEPVVAEAEAGNIRAKQMTLNSKLRQATFENDVHVTLKANASAKGSQKSAEKPAEAAEPGDKAGAPAKASAALKPASALPGLAANSGQPIEVKSQRLDVDDVAKTALFRADVIARQGDAVLEAPEMDVLYEGKAAIGETVGADKPGEAQTKLKTIKARVGVVMTNKEDRATSETVDYDAETERVVMLGNVTLASGAERKATAARADLDQKKDTALLTGDVLVTQGKNTMKGRRLAIDRKSGKTRLDAPAEADRPTGRIQTVFYQSTSKAGAEKADKAATAKSADATGGSVNPFGASFKTDPNAPIEIDAETLDIADLQKQAIFRGSVVAKQGEFVVRTPMMTAHYTGQTGISGSGQVTPKATAGKDNAGQGQGAQLTKVEARQAVVVTGREGQRAEGEWADFDVKANTIVMGGKVTVSQGRNVVSGPDGTRFVINMTTGEAKFEQPPGVATAGPATKAGPAVSAAAAATDEVSAQIAATPAPKPRMRALLYRNDVQEATKQQKPGEPGQKSGALVKKPDKAKKEKKEKQAKDGTGSSAWQSTTTPVVEKKP